MEGHGERAKLSPGENQSKRERESEKSKREREREITHTYTQISSNKKVICSLYREL